MLANGLPSPLRHRSRSDQVPGLVRNKSKKSIRSRIFRRFFAQVEGRLAAIALDFFAKQLWSYTTKDPLPA
jgi:hypothetical protein